MIGSLAPCERLDETLLHVCPCNYVTRSGGVGVYSGVVSSSLPPRCPAHGLKTSDLETKLHILQTDPTFCAKKSESVK